MKNYEYNPADHKFETLAEFKIYLSCGANVDFEFDGVKLRDFITTDDVEITERIM